MGDRREREGSIGKIDKLICGNSQGFLRPHRYGMLKNQIAGTPRPPLTPSPTTSRRHLPACLGSLQMMRSVFCPPRSPRGARCAAARRAAAGCRRLEPDVSSLGPTVLGGVVAAVGAAAARGQGRRRHGGSRGGHATAAKVKTPRGRAAFLGPGRGAGPVLPRRRPRRAGRRRGGCGRGAASEAAQARLAEPGIGERAARHAAAGRLAPCRRGCVAAAGPERPGSWL